MNRLDVGDFYMTAAFVHAAGSEDRTVRRRKSFWTYQLLLESPLHGDYYVLLEAEKVADGDFPCNLSDGPNHLI